MNRIFISFIFIFLNIPITIGDSHIGLLPDFVGYILIIRGLTELAENAPKVNGYKKTAKILAYLTGLMYIFDLFDLSHKIGIFMLIPDVVRLVLGLVLCYKILSTITEIEQERNADFHTENLYSAYKFLCVGCSAAMLMSYANIGPVLRYIVNIVPYLWFLFQFYRTKECMLASERS